MSDKSIIYSQDTFSIAGISFEGTDFISGTASNTSGKVSDDHYTSYWFGLGLSTNIASQWSDGNGSSQQHNTILQALVNQGSVQSQAYSIWLDPDNMYSGHLLLGGINSGRYHWPLTELTTSTFTSDTISQFANLPLPPQVIILIQIRVLFRNQLTLTLTTVSLTYFDTNDAAIEAQSITGPAPISSFAIGYNLIDYFSYFPPVYAKGIWDAVQAKYNLSDIDPTPLVPCSFLQQRITLDLTILGSSNITISIPISDLTYQTGTGPNLDYGPNKGSCQLAIKATPPGLPNYLSKRVLRSLYLLFDLQNTVISAAPVNHNSNATDNIIPVPPKGLSAIPQSAFGNGSSGVPPSSTATSAAKPAPKNDKKSVLVPLLATLLPVLFISAILALYFVNKRRRKRLSEQWEREDRQRAEAAGARQEAKETPVHNFDINGKVEGSTRPEELPTDPTRTELAGSSGLPRYTSRTENRKSMQERIDAGEIIELA